MSKKTEANGFDDWVEIFAGGRQKDSNGVERNGDTLIDAAVSSFDPSYHEPPAVLGHPKDNTPAYGWVSNLKAEAKNGANRLYAKFKQVVPEFADAVKSGRFKKRSAAFYPDGRLRHVGWLGAMPPAVKGLADVNFSEDDNAISFEFTETKTPTKKENKMKFSDFVDAMKFWKKIQDDPDADMGDFLPPSGNRKPDASFTEADVEAARTEAAKAAKEEGKKEAAAEFAEAEKNRKNAETKETIKIFIADGIKNGTIAPAWANAGLAEFMEALDAETVIEFGEGDGSEKKTGLAWFTDFVSGLPKLIDFSEVASRDKDVKGGNAGKKLEGLVKTRLTENKDMTYSAAFSEVMDEHPDLAAEYQQEIS